MAFLQIPEIDLKILQGLGYVPKFIIILSTLDKTSHEFIISTKFYQEFKFLTTKCLSKPRSTYISKKNVKLNYLTIKYCCKHELTNLLKIFLVYKCSDSNIGCAIDKAIKYNKIKILKWLKFEFDIQCPQDMDFFYWLAMAELERDHLGNYLCFNSSFGRENIIEWFKNCDYELK